MRNPALAGSLADPIDSPPRSDWMQGMRRNISLMNQPVELNKHATGGSKRLRFHGIA
jgi:hypothetical protein